MLPDDRESEELLRTVGSEERLVPMKKENEEPLMKWDVNESRMLGKSSYWEVKISRTRRNRNEAVKTPA